MKKISPIDNMLGSEPVWVADTEHDNKTSMIKALNWYNYNCSKKDAKEFILDYLKKVNRPKDEVATIKSLPDTKVSLQVGWLARMLCMGFIPSDSTKKFFCDGYKKLLVAEPKEDSATAAPVVAAAPVVNIQDRIREKASEVSGEIEGLIDDFVISKCKTPIDVEAYIKGLQLSSVVLKKVCDNFVDHSKEITEAISGSDKQLVEGYSNFSKVELRRLREFMDSIVTATNKVAIVSKPARKKRVSKEKPAAILVAKVQYQKECPELKLKSITPDKMIGATQVWTYNTKTKLLGLYVSENAKGFSMKGTTLQNFDSATSIGKRLRKPEVVLKEVLEAGKVKLKKILPDLKTKECVLTGRINSDTIILKVT